MEESSEEEEEGDDDDDDDGSEAEFLLEGWDSADLNVLSDQHWDLVQQLSEPSWSSWPQTDLLFSGLLKLKKDLSERAICC